MENTTILTNLLRQLFEKLYGWVEGFVLILPNLIVALLVIVVFLYLSRFGERIANKILARISDNEQINGLLSSMVKIGIVAAGLFTALGILQLEKTVTSLLAGVGIIGLALGFAFQDLAANFMSGIIMSITRPFKKGEMIETNGFQGIVDTISLRSTKVRTFDGQLVLLPNKDVFGGPLINYSEDPKRRMDLSVGVSYGDDLRKVKEIAASALQGVPNRIGGRDVEVYFEEFGDSSINFQIRVWITSYKPADFLSTRDEAVILLKEAFDQNGITIPFPIRTLDFGIPGGTPLSEELKNSK